jgi:hypothetical protein
LLVSLLNWLVAFFSEDFSGSITKGNTPSTPLKGTDIDDDGYALVDRVNRSTFPPLFGTPLVLVL